MFLSRFVGTFAGLAILCCEWSHSTASAGIVDLTLTIENLSPTDSISFAPTRVGFHNGSFDPFNNGEPAGAAIVSIAEGGSGSDWFPALAAADPNSVSGTVVANGGPAVPTGNVGGLTNTATATFRIDTDSQGFFSFANMVVPSNDLFLANDAPLDLFDSNGDLQFFSILQFGSDIWDANSEQPIAANAAFLVGANNSERVAENGLVAFDFSELSTYNGLQTAAGYTFDSAGITAGTQIFRIGFSSSAVAVPEPSSFLSFAVVAGACGIRRWRKRGRLAVAGV